MFLSIIIPTFNRSGILKECLEAFLSQDIEKKNYEIIVVDDGSVDTTRDIIDGYMKKNANVVYLYQHNKGQGTARNLGISKAQGDIILFSQDDIIVPGNFCSEHLRYHLRFPEENHGVLGLTVWHPKLTLTPIMKWLTNGSSIFGRFGGHQFAYEKLQGMGTADYNFFYTSNISLKRSLLARNMFDSAFSGYGWEDIELGYRLHKSEAMVLHYNPKALAYHHHIITDESFKGRMRSIGSSAWLIQNKYPELKKIPTGFKKFSFKVLAHPITILMLKAIRYISQGKYSNLYFYALSKKYFLEGLKKITN